MTRLGTVACGVLVACLTALGAGAAPDAQIEELERALGEQRKLLDAQQKRLEQLEKTIEKLKADRAKQAAETEENVTALREKLQTLSTAEARPLDGDDFRVYWDKGLRLKSADGRTKLKIGGRIMNDWAWMDEDGDIRDSFGDLEDSVEFRRARLYTSGTVYDNIDFKLQFDFAGGDADLKDAYMGLKGLPVYLKGGHFKEPMGLEELTSSKYITFMERSLPTEAFTPSRNAGFQVSSTALGEGVTWATGLFTDTDGFGEGETESGWSATARLAGTPWYEDAGRRLLHLGGSASYRTNADDEFRFRARPEMHLAPRFVDTGTFEPDSVNLAGAEAAFVYGPFSLQGELFKAHANGLGALLTGWYAQASYFLTGEHRAYKRSSGSFSRVSPNKNFNPAEGGYGAWEVAARYSTIDLDDSPLLGGEQDDFTLGLNWHLNPNMRIMCNYVRADRDEIGQADLLGMRLQIDF